MRCTDLWPQSFDHVWVWVVFTVILLTINFISFHFCLYVLVARVMLPSAPSPAPAWVASLCFVSFGNFLFSFVSCVMFTSRLGLPVTPSAQRQKPFKQKWLFVSPSAPDVMVAGRCGHEGLCGTFGSGLGGGGRPGHSFKADPLIKPPPSFGPGDCFVVQWGGSLLSGGKLKATDTSSKNWKENQSLCVKLDKKQK